MQNHASCTLSECHPSDSLPPPSLPNRLYPQLTCSTAAARHARPTPPPRGPPPGSCGCPTCGSQHSNLNEHAPAVRRQPARFVHGKGMLLAFQSRGILKRHFQHQQVALRDQLVTLRHQLVTLPRRTQTCGTGGPPWRCGSAAAAHGTHPTAGHRMEDRVKCQSPQDGQFVHPQAAARQLNTTRESVLVGMPHTAGKQACRCAASSVHLQHST